MNYFFTFELHKGLLKEAQVLLPAHINRKEE